MRVLTRLPPGSAMLTAREVAELLGVHMNTLKRIPPARLPYFVVSSRGDRRYATADLELFLASSREPNNPTPLEPPRARGEPPPPIGLQLPGPSRLRSRY